MKKTIALLASIVLCFNLFSQNYEASWSSLDSRRTPQWFSDAKFGIFIHWGLYSVPSWAPAPHNSASGAFCYAEHYWHRIDSENSKEFQDFHRTQFGENFRYQDFAKDFKAEMFNPDEWASIFESSGAKYVILTSKHHESFCLWPSQYAWNWNALDIGPHRDLLGQLTDAVRAKGLKMGYYYSLLEWYNPLYTPETITEYVETHMIPQMKELVETYHPDVVWPDGEWDYKSSVLHTEKFLQWLFNESSVKDKVVINDRWGSDCRSVHGGFYTTEYGVVDGKKELDSKSVHPWEECRGIAASFGFNRNENLTDYSTSEQLVELLIETVANGGNLLLNVGPTADGRIPLLFQQRLNDMGAWLKVNGEAIFGTCQSDATASDKDIYLTKKDDAKYVIMTSWKENSFKIKGFDRKPKSVTLLGTDIKASYSYANGELTVKAVKLNSPNELPCQYAWVLKVE